jgi:hypothetical protein
MDVVTYALLSKKISGLASGIQSAVVNGTTITFTMNDGSVQEMIFPEPEDGISVTGMTIDENNNLICELSDGNSINAGEIPTITTVETIVEEKVQEQIETQLDNTIQEKIDQAIEETLGGGSGDGSDSSTDDEIDSWFQ